MRFNLQGSITRWAITTGLVAGTVGSSHAVFQVIMDGEDSEFRVASGNTWVLDKTGRYMGNYRFSAPKGSGSARCVWDIDAIPDGAYNVEFFIDNGDYAENAEFIIEHDGGTALVTRSQRARPEGWYSLGTFNFTGAGRVTMPDTWTGLGTKVIADALRITLQGDPAPPLPGSLPPEVSIVVDDLGALNPAQGQNNFTTQLFSTSPELSFAIIPRLTYTSATLQAAYNQGIETIMHQPLQFIGQANVPVGSDPVRLYVNRTDAQIRQTLDENLALCLPNVVGVNNHQGSLFSQFQHGMDVMTEHLHSKGLPFLDSRTISDSYGYDEAKKQGMLASERDLFVDGVFTSAQTVAASTAYERIKWLSDRAVYAPNYNYIMICHQRTETVSDLIAAVDDLISSGVAVVPQSRNLHYIVETDAIPPGATVLKDGGWTSTTRDMISHEVFDGEAVELAAGTPGSATFSANLPRAGKYRVLTAAPSGSNAAANVQAVVTHRFGAATVPVNQAVHINRWQYLGTYEFSAGINNATVRLEKTGSAAPTEILRADAVKFTYAGPPSASVVGEWGKY